MMVHVVIQVQSRMYGDLPRVNLDNKLISDVNQINLFPMSNQGILHFQDMPFTHLMHCDITFFMPVW